MKIKSNLGTLILVWMMIISLLPTLGNSKNNRPKSASGKTEQDKTQKLTNPDIPKFALLVGINNYKSKNVPSLEGCLNDVNLMKRTLIRKFRFADDKTQIKTLTQTEATREAIITNIRTQLIDNAKKNEGKNPLIIFYFSGHGSRVADQDGDEPDGKDETIVPYDSRQGNIFDIKDDELDELMDEIAQYTSNMVFILDSCHSGTGTRGGDNENNDNRLVRLAQDDKRPQPKSDITPRSGRADKSDKYVTLSAALSSQLAQERNRKKTKIPNGAFTYCLAQALERATEQTSYRDLMREVATSVGEETGNTQDPQSEGDISRLVFGGQANQSDPSIDIIRIDKKENTISFRAGRAHGVRPGTQVAIYKPQATDLKKRSDNLLAVATVSLIDDFESIADLPKDNPKVKEITESARAVLLSPNWGGGPVMLSLGVGFTAKDWTSKNSVVNSIVSELDSRLLFDNRLVETEEKSVMKTNSTESEKKNSVLKEGDNQYVANIQLRKDKFKNVFPDELSKRYIAPLEEGATLPTDDTEILYLSSGGYALYGFFIPANHPKAAEKIAAVLEHYAKQRNLLALSNSVSSLSKEENIKITFEKVNGTFQDGIRDGKKVKMFVESNREAMNSDTCKIDNETKNYPCLDQQVIYGFSITNKTNRKDLFVTAILAGADGGIKIIYPRIKGAQEALSPGRSTPTSPLRTTQPPGKETLVVIVTTKYVDFGFLELNGLKITKDIAQRGEDMLGELLAQSGFKTRDEGVVTTNPENWGVLKFDFVVTEKKAQ